MERPSLVWVILRLEASLLANFLNMTTFENPGCRRVGTCYNGYDGLKQPGRRYPKNIRCQGHQCPICRRWFYTNHEKQTFCSVACWYQWLREHSRRAICPACKCNFNPHRTGRGGLQRCCSRRCAGFYARGSTNSLWKHGRYALPIPAEIQPEAPIRKHRMGTKRRIRTPLERERYPRVYLKALPQNQTQPTPQVPSLDVHSNERS